MYYFHFSLTRSHSSRSCWRLWQNHAAVLQFLEEPYTFKLYVFADDDAEYQELVEYALISLGYPFVSLTPQETALMIGIKAYKMQHPGKSLLPDLNAMQLRLDNMEKRYNKFKSNEDSFNLTQFIVDNSARYERIL